MVQPVDSVKFWLRLFNYFVIFGPMFTGPKSKALPPKYASSTSTPSSASYSPLSLSIDSPRRCCVHVWMGLTRKSIGDWIRIFIQKYITSIGWINRSVCAVNCRSDRLIYGYNVLKAGLFRWATNLCEYIGSPQRAIYTAFGLSCAIVFFVLLWSLIVFDVPHAPALYISALILGNLIPFL